MTTLKGYLEKFPLVWIEKDSIVIQGNKSYKQFQEQKKHHENIGSGATSYEILLKKDNMLYLIIFSTLGMISNIYDVTNEDFYDDEYNRKTILQAYSTLHINRTYVHGVNTPNRELISEIFEIFRSVNILSEKANETYISIKNKTVHRDDIISIQTMARENFKFETGLILIEEKEKIIVTTEHPYNVLHEFYKNLIFGMELYEHGFTISENVMFKL